MFLTSFEIDDHHVIVIIYSCSIYRKKNVKMLNNENVDLNENYGILVSRFLACLPFMILLHILAVGRIDGL